MASLLLGGGIYPAIVSGKVAGEYVVEDKANEFNGRINERMGKWFWLQDISREILGCVDGHDLDKALSIVKEYGASSVCMSKEARRLLSSLGRKIPSLFLKDVRNIFRSVGS
ncbi:hypothetical protein AKJ43_02100 [candidate division MSBL1 archaeon SCGC-AAA261D19]|uniref:Uncharacterized protein n=1 Tax=candidate division MSBL1 archaeon SCGC-AAA261D19 TaxID=1698273 RepID=A0A133V772_9EURY|nr:hypothetical protein AKJ43_02100 [candidate division MSBL1 archaeon SCGC-AAA261D19]